MGTVDITVEKPRGKIGDTTYGDFRGFYESPTQVSFPQRFKKISAELRDKQGNHSPYDYF